MDETGAYNTKWSKSERKTAVQYINICVCVCVCVCVEFRKMVMMTLYARQQKRHRCKNRLLDSVGEGKGGMIWENSIEIDADIDVKLCELCEIDDQSMFEASNRALKASALGQPWGMGWGGRWEGGSGRGTHVHPWLIHVNVWQKPPQYCN